MGGRRVAILSLSTTYSPGTYQAFSYAAYRIQAALTGWPGVAEVRVFEGHGWTTERFAAEIEAFDPDVVGASVYVWSLPVFAELAAVLKRARPDRVYVMGGPSARPEMLDLPPYRPYHEGIDALVIGEGEEVIREIVDGWNGRDTTYLRGIPGMALPSGTGWLRTGPRRTIQDLDRIPSPFQLGLAPRGISGHLETFRGCPLSCLFCEWGVSGNRGSWYHQEYLVRELEAFAALGSKRVFQVDAGLNLNAKAFANLYAAEKQVGALKNAGFMCELYPSHLKDEHLEFLGGMRAAHVGVGLQSFNPEVLRRIQRPFDPEKIGPCVARLAEVCEPTVEIIVGLPGDSPAGFRETFRRARDLAGGVRVFYCLVLPDAFLTRAPPEFAMDFDPVTLQMRSCLGWSARDLEAMIEWLSAEALAAGGNFSIQPHGRTGRPDLDGTVAFAKESTWWYFPPQSGRAARFHHREERPAVGDGGLPPSFGPS